MATNLFKSKSRIFETASTNSGGGGIVNSVVAGTNISVDNTDPANPIVSSTADDITVVANYSALPAVGTVTGKFYWCSASQGTSWLPGSLGGTYYSAGLYYSNGVTWEFLDVPYQATQAEVNTGTNTDKFVTPSTLANYTGLTSKVASVTGTTNRITIGGTATNPTVDIAATYVGQTSITTLGIITTGTLGSGSKILVGSDATGDMYYNGGSGAITRSSLLNFDGTIFTANALKSNASGIYVGANAATSTYLLNLTSNQNAGTVYRLLNNSAGSSAYVGAELYNGTGTLELAMLGTGFSTSGVYTQAGATIRTAGAGGISIAADNAAGILRFYAGGTTERMRIDSSGYIGIKGTPNTAANAGTLQVYPSNTYYFQNYLSSTLATGMTSLAPTTAAGYTGLIGSATEGGVQYFGFTGNIASIAALEFVGASGHATPTTAPVRFRGAKKSGTAIGVVATTEEVIAFENYTTRLMTLLGSGNLKIAGTATRATTEGTNHLDIFDGTAPVGTLTNGISLYSTSGELRVMDSAGNATLLSPHEKGTNYWIYDSVDTTTGKHLRIDMEQMMKAINEKFGWDFVKEYIKK